MAGKIIPDDLITTINDFKSTSNGQMINIHGKEYATVAHRVAVLRRNLGAKLSITTEVVSITDNKVVVKATGSISGVVVVDCDNEEAEHAAYDAQMRSVIKVKTKRGTHLYFEHPKDGVRRGPRAGVNSRGADWPKINGLDFRGDGSYAVMSNGDQVSVSKRRKDTFLAALGSA